MIHADSASAGPNSAVSPERHLDADFWIEKANRANDRVLSTEAIERFNSKGFATDPSLTDLAALPGHLPGQEIKARILAMSRRNKLTLFFHEGGRVEESDYLEFETMLALENIEAHVPVRFGMALQRTDLRTWPSARSAYKNDISIDLDRFQEHGLFPGDAVAILHASRDGDWWFVCSYNYGAWVRREHIAPAPRETVLDYAAACPFIVVTGGKVRTNYNPRCAALSELQLDMGVRLPLAVEAPGGNAVDGQNPYTSHTVQLPVRGDDGTASLQNALVARSQDVRLGYLEYTRANVLRQGFKFLGERYGWGHSYNARDCSGLVTDIYRSMGVLLPRNTRQQVDSPMGETLHFTTDDNREARLRALDELQPGDLLYSPGHVMIYVGHDGGRPYVLHDTSSCISFETADGGTYRGVLNGVSVTPFVSMQDEDGAYYLDTLWAIKKIH